MDIVVVDNQTDLISAREELLSAEEFGGDIETTGFNCRAKEMTLLQLSPHGERSFVFDTRKLRDPNDFEFVKDILASDRVVMFQNGKFDLQFLTHFFGGKPLAVKSFYDTMIVSKILARGDKTLRHDLGSIAYREAGMMLDKSLQKSDFGATEISQEQIEYAARDSAILHSIRDRQKAKAGTYNLGAICRLESDAVAALADAEYGGIYLDAEEWTERTTHQAQRAEELSKEILNHLQLSVPVIDLWGTPVINLDSPHQLGPALRNLGIPIGESTAEAELVHFREKHPIINLLLEYRENTSPLSKYGLEILNFIDSVDNRIHPDYQQIEAPSGRMSIRKPAMQTIPADPQYRTPFKAQFPGGSIITADYGQIELRIMAKLSGDPILTAAYMNNEDLHNVTCHHVLGEPLENPNPDKRRIAKNLNFGTAYGVSAPGFAVTANVTVAFAEKALESFWKVYRVLGDYLKRQADMASNHGHVVTMTGRSAVLKFDREDKQKYNAARRLGRNFGVQGTGADILKRALYLLRNQIIALGLRATVVNIVHDEIVVETYDDARYVANIVESVMIEAGTEYLDPIPCVVGIKIGSTWIK